MKKEFVMRGQTASGETEVLNFSGVTDGYAYRLVEFSLYSNNPLATGTSPEASGTITSGKVAIAPIAVNFNEEALIASAMLKTPASSNYGPIGLSVINDTFLITQNLILMVQETSSAPINWQCRFVSVKMSGPEEAAANYRQYAISDE